MRRLIVIALIFSLGHSSVAFAAGPLLESALRAARQLAQTQAEPPKAAEARRIATDLGVGRHVAVKLTSGKTVRGDLQTINNDHFVLLLDLVATPMEIAYGEVEELGPAAAFRSSSFWSNLSDEQIGALFMLSAALLGGLYAYLTRD